MSALALTTLSLVALILTLTTFSLVATSLVTTIHLSHFIIKS